jgi:homocysteine S-methyltransferase
MRAAVALAVAAREEFWSAPANRLHRLRPLVAASVGPYGAMLADGSEYRGRYALDDDALADFHRPRLQLLAASGADLLACETIPCLREALVLAKLLQELPGVCAWMSFSCRDGGHTSEGDSIAACAAALRGFPHIAAVGVNCTAPQYIASLLRRLRTATDRPLVIYPNSGESYDPSSKQWNGGPDAPGAISPGVGAPAAAPPFAERVRLWYAEGARLIGGCCRTGPLDIRGVRQCLQPEHSF